MKMFRIDNRTFAVGDEITPQNLYQGRLNEVGLRIEEILEQHRPHQLPARNAILMLFQNFDEAKKYWTIQTNAKFYRVEIEDAQVLHIGDYNKVEELFRNINNPEIAAQIAQDYWGGIMTENPKPEVFVLTAQVSQIISNSERERKNAYSIRGGFDPSPGVRIINDVQE